MPEPKYADQLSLQSGVITRRQLTELGAAPHDRERMLRKRELVRVHDRVFINHTGEPTWLQRAWIGVQIAWPAALAADSAIRADDGPGRAARDDSMIHVVVDRDRRARLPSGFRLHRVTGLDEKVGWNASPPRVRIEEALIDVASRARDDFAAISALADAIQAPAHDGRPDPRPPRRTARSTATSSTATSARSWSSTAACGTTVPPSATLTSTGTSTGTSTPRSADSTPCGSDGARCSTAHAPPRRGSAYSSRPRGGEPALPPVPTAATTCHWPADLSAVLVTWRSRRHDRTRHGVTGCPVTAEKPVSRRRWPRAGAEPVRRPRASRGRRRTARRESTYDAPRHRRHGCGVRTGSDCRPPGGEGRRR
jgi:hypothetical protein